MLLDLEKAAETRKSHNERGVAFGAIAASRIRSSTKTQFSLLPHEELLRLSSAWYAASAEAMLANNFSLIQSWTRTQAGLAASQNFQPEDLIELLRICRATGIECERWSEDIFSVVDDEINDAMRSIGSDVAWKIPAALDYVHGVSSVAASKSATGASAVPPATVAIDPEPGDVVAGETWAGDWSNDRRDCGRNSLKFPIRVRSKKDLSIDELTYSENVSRGGLYFVSRTKAYQQRMVLMVTYPYWSEPGAINREYSAKVVRRDAMTDGSVGVAVEFTETLGPRPRK